MKQDLKLKVVNAEQMPAGTTKLTLRSNTRVTPAMRRAIDADPDVLSVVRGGKPDKLTVVVHEYADIDGDLVPIPPYSKHCEEWAEFVTDITERAKAA